MNGRLVTGLIAGGMLLCVNTARGQNETLTLAEINTLVQQMNAFNIFSNLYTTIENLDDRLNPDANPGFQNVNDDGGALVIRPNEGIPFRRILTGSQWDGPYVNISPSRWEDESGDYDEGTFLDLASMTAPYYLYTPLGLVEPKTGDLSQRFYGDDFDTYAIVSHGLDGVKSDDDIIVEFGSFLTITAVSSATASLNSSRMKNDYVITIRGYNFGMSPGEVWFNGAPLDNISIETWSPTEIVCRSVKRPPRFLVNVVTAEGEPSRRSVKLAINAPELEADVWSFYQ